MFRHGAHGDVAPKFATLWLVPCSALCPVVCTFAENFAGLKLLRIAVHQLFIPTAGYTVKVVKVRLQQLLRRRVSECGRDLYWDGGISTFAVGWNCIAEFLQFNCSLWNHLRNGKKTSKHIMTLKCRLFFLQYAAFCTFCTLRSGSWVLAYVRQTQPITAQIYPMYLPFIGHHLDPSHLLSIEIFNLEGD